MARTLVELGARVALVDREIAGCAALADEPQMAGQVATFEVDITSKAEVEHLRDEVQSQLGPIDIAIQNAGIGVFTPHDDRTEEEFTSVLDVNLRGTFHCIQAFGGAMAERGGVMINIASVYGLVSPDPRVYGDSGRNSAEVYGATKAGVVQMTRYYAVHYASRKIRVNSISPGGVFADQDPAFVSAYEARTPMGRMGKPKDLQGAIAYLASDASAYVTGHNLVVDGGFTAW
jgi:NAD(P)-dependent dehydrogenase (short-subunit alcohol dehydrogenase family)